MTDNPNGNPLSVDERMANLDKKIEEYTKGLGLPTQTTTTLSEVESILNKNRDDIRKMLKEDCSTAAIFLLNFNFYLQRAINKELRIIEYCKECINKIIVKRVSQQRAASYEERRQLAIREDEAATKYDNLRAMAAVRVSETQFMVNRVQAIAEAYRDASKVRRENA